MGIFVVATLPAVRQQGPISTSDSDEPPAAAEHEPLVVSSRLLQRGPAAQHRSDLWLLGLLQARLFSQRLAATQDLSNLRRDWRITRRGPPGSERLSRRHQLHEAIMSICAGRLELQR